MAILSGYTTGEVLDNKDPSFSGLLSVRLEGMYAYDVAIEGVYPCDFQRGLLNLPEVGDRVEIVYDETDTKADPADDMLSTFAPAFRWRHVAPTESDGHAPLPEPFRENYPHVRGMITRRGHFILFCDLNAESEQYAAYGLAKGHRVIHHPDGSVTIHATDGSFVSVESDGKVLAVANEGAIMVLDGASATIMSKGGAYVSVQDDIVEVASASTINFTAPQIVLNTLSTNGVLLGQGASVGVSKADGVLNYLNVLLNWIVSMKAAYDAHTHPAPGGATSPPTSPAPTAPDAPDSTPGGAIKSNKALVL